jgi:nitronate monooxygenase
MKYSNDFTRALQLRYPIVMAPMFLVSNEAMLVAAMESGILGAFPSLNYRGDAELNAILVLLNQRLAARQAAGLPGNYAVNLIVQKTNLYYRRHLAICVAQRVPVYITSLGNPSETIEAAHAYGARVYCDVTNMEHARKCDRLGCDGFIAVGQGAGGHAGNNPLPLLVETLTRHFPGKPVLAAGGIATGRSLLAALAAGASAGYIGTRFIASTECPVPQAYKDAVIQSGMDDIIMTERLSGTPCAVINTPYARKIGTRQNRLEKWLSSNPRTKRYFKTLVSIRGLKRLEAAVKPGNYQNLWCAGRSAELVERILPVRAIVEELVAGFDEARARLNAQCDGE